MLFELVGWWTVVSTDQVFSTGSQVESCERWTLRLGRYI